MMFEQDIEVVSSRKEANKAIEEYKQKGYFVKMISTSESFFSFSITILFEKAQKHRRKD